MSKREEFYKKLKTQLDDTSTFPTDYLYKFIVPAEGDKVESVQNLFNKGGAIINTKKSKTGKYISVSIRLKVASSDEVISYYKEAESIEGIISL
ncbi:hypothetical protein WH52_02590 [Tenacibaculum holothuriorum]|uniref:DUF493 domain-containing protein n=1 Tax=Tenacibaculum holothuriorum TaxID=1635173 RepID=A0A1Y2PIH5_9FLAO|nr:DUF493 family protein [Tenacibaculum holothuriorum]OSY89539.1 hypothetical protein WH52_02590 [Tenacibaculum holothuriorum]